MAGGPRFALRDLGSLWHDVYLPPRTPMACYASLRPMANREPRGDQKGTREGNGTPVTRQRDWGALANRSSDLRY